MNKVIGQHLHFYQPRRNDYYTEKINQECYKPLAENGVFKHISFNVGPTLMDWMEKNDKKTLDSIIQSDEGQAIAQPYSHRLLPLANDLDVETQIIWGKKHFEKYFKREPKGMWLPETATSKRVLKKLVEHGIEYTIGGFNQNKTNNQTDKVFEIDLDGEKIKYFFFNEISPKLAFNSKREKNGGAYLDNVERTLEELREKEDGFILLAYDGETFGHHKPFTEKWQAYFPEGVAKVEGLDLMLIHNLNGEFTMEGEVHEDSSWSCLCGGLKRWTVGCGCAGAEKGYKEQLFEVARKQEDVIHDIYEIEGKKFLNNPWSARNDYIDLKLKTTSWGDFVNKHFTIKTSSAQEKMKELLEAEYYTQLSMTSCGWFFDNIHPQTRNNIEDLRTAAEHVRRGTGINLNANFNKVEWMLKHVS